MIFLDTSALVKAYVDEPGTEHMLAILDRFKGMVFVSSHVAVETLATLAYKRRDGRLTSRRYRRLREEFLQDYGGEFHRLAVTEDVLAIAMKLAHQFWNLGVGAVDLIHVATALESRQRTGVPLTVACADRSMRLLAAAAGFRVFDPEKDDPARLDPHAPGLE